MIVLCLVNWGFIVSKRYDLLFFIMPGIFSVLFSYLVFKQFIPLSHSVSDLQWVFFILLCDVSHVYVTIYRIYLDPKERKYKFYYIVPSLVLVLSFVIYLFVGEMAFWSMLAYMALTHFIKQQDGFVSLYRYKENLKNPWVKYSDKFIVYASTLIPVAYWHSHLPREFAWFKEGDFLGVIKSGDVTYSILSDSIMPFFWGVYALALAQYLFQRCFLVYRKHAINAFKDLFVLTTALIWYVGIVHYNFDLAFTVTNVLLHGISYMALNWFVLRNRSELKPNSILALVRKSLTLFLVIIAALAFTEEFLWEKLINHEKETIFGSFMQIELSSWGLALAVSLLSLPQFTHYVLDAFIWRLDGSNSNLRDYLGLNLWK